MAKMIVIEATQVNYLDGKGAVHEDVGAEIEVNDDVGFQLAKAGKAMWSDPEADPSKGRYLLPDYIRAAIQAQTAPAETESKKGGGRE